MRSAQPKGSRSRKVADMLQTLVEILGRDLQAGMVLYAGNGSLVGKLTQTKDGDTIPGTNVASYMNARADSKNSNIGFRVEKATYCTVDAASLPGVITFGVTIRARHVVAGMEIAHATMLKPKTDGVAANYFRVHSVYMRDQFTTEFSFGVGDEANRITPGVDLRFEINPNSIQSYRFAHAPKPAPPGDPLPFGKLIGPWHVLIGQVVDDPIMLRMPEFSDFTFDDFKREGYFEGLPETMGLWELHCIAHEVGDGGDDAMIRFDVEKCEAFIAPSEVNRGR